MIDSGMIIERDIILNTDFGCLFPVLSGGALRINLK